MDRRLLRSSRNFEQNKGQIVNELDKEWIAISSPE